MAGGTERATGAVVAGLRLAVYTTIFGAISLFLAQLFFYQATFWSNPAWSLNKFQLTSSRADHVSVKLTDRQRRVTSNTVLKQTIFWWGGLLVAALSSIWLKGWPFSLRLPVDAALHRGFSRCQAKVARVLKTQLPPHRFWAWLLHGGLSLLDLIIVLLFVGAMACVAATEATATWANCRERYRTTGKWCATTYVGSQLHAAGLGTGFAACCGFMLVFLPIPRASFLEYLFGADFFTLIKYHKWIGHGTFTVLLVHAVCFYSQFIYNGDWIEEALAWNPAGVNVLAGGIAGLFALLMWVTAISWVRRNHFNIFFCSHIIGAAGFLAFGMMHYANFVIFMPGLVLYMLDLVYRLSQWGVASDLHCSFLCEADGFATLSITFLQGSDVRACNVVFLNVPAISAFEWHPVTIAAVLPDEAGRMSTAILHMKTYGAWTQALVKLLREQPDSVKVRADGPYGSSSARPAWAAFNSLLLIAGGVGITPLLGIVREIVAARKQEAQRPAERLTLLPQRVRLVWAVRKLQELDMLDEATVNAVSEGWLEMDLYWSAAPDKAPVQHSLVPLRLSPKQDAMEAHVRHLPPYKVSDAQWAATHVLAFLGGFCGLIMSQAFIYERYITLPRGMIYYERGLMNLLFLVIGSMGLPALLIYPMQRFRYRRHVAACRADATQRAHLRLDSDEKLRPAADKGAELLEASGGVPVTVKAGRPDLPELVQRVAKGLSSTDRCIVCASGPTQLQTAARVAVTAANQSLRVAGGPEMAFEAHSFSL